LHNKGFINAELKQYERALAYYDQAIDLRPGFALALYNKGMALSDLKKREEALVCYQRAFEIDPELDWLSGQILHTKMLLCDWSDFNQEQSMIKKMIFDGKRAAQPFTTHSLFDSPSLHQKSAIAFGLHKHPENKALGSNFLNKKQKKIKLGYFSADFRNHPVAYLLAEFFELHDRTNFEITAFYYGPIENGEMHSRLRNAFDQFVEVRDKSDKEVAQLSRALEIDIAVDLGGFTQLSRPGIFSYRAAPIQASYIGYLGTTGLGYMDYLIADQIIIPKENIRFYSEKIIFLPSYQVNDRNRRIAQKKFSRADLGLTDDAFVFCCFNNHYKVTPPVFDGWMRILKSVDKSVLYLYAEDDQVKSNLEKEAEIRGVNPTRLIFGGPIERADYLARYQIADLFLDTTPYNAGTTASDALWAGLPVLTLIGDSFPSRVAASILSAIGLHELVTTTQEGYELLAIELATNPIKLNRIKDLLAQNRNSAPLFDAPQFTRSIEKAYRLAYSNYHSGFKPKHIFV
jgi:predicted O-linked N-acetylglucosamine transferase (SPINDLY family)